ALSAIDNGDGLPVASRGVRVALIGALTLIVKMQSTPDLGHVYEAVKIGQVETKAAAESLAHHVNSLKNELNETNTKAQQTMEVVQRNSEIAMDAKTAAKEATEIGKATMKMIRDMKLVSQQNHASITPTYANVMARGGLATSIHNPQNQKASPVQTVREIIINIRDPVTIANIRAMSPRSLKSHVDLAIAQSSNEHIEKIKVVSSNQLRSGDLSIKTATSSDMVALRQFAEDWEQRIGNGATVRIPTYGVLVHGVRTSSMDMDNFELIRDGLLQDNKPFIPTAEIKYIGWLTRSSSSKSASSVVVEFTRPEDANKVIDEGLIWQGEVFQCELYDRQCRVRQCFQCHKYGHIGTQCKATITCGYCAQEHPTRDCPTKSDRDAPRKCAACNGVHEAWNNQCPVRKQEVNKAKAASKLRPRYHLELESFVTRISTGTRTRERQNNTNTITRTGRPILESGRPQDASSTRSRSPTKRLQKRANPGSDQVASDNPDNEIVYNVRKSKDTVMATLLRDPDIGRYDILAIQEPWKNPFDTTTHHPAKDQFHLCYPDKDQTLPARVCFFINKRLDHSRWHFEEANRDLGSLNLRLGTEEEQRIMVHNVYNPTQTATERGSTLPLLGKALEQSSQHEQIIIGDFNLHHELWGGDRVQRADPNAAELITIIEDHCLTSNLVPGTITYEERDGRTTIDLCLTTAGLVGRLIQCEIETNMDHDSDHLPIVTSLDLNIVKMMAKPRRNWKALDEKTFTRVLQRELPPQQRPRTKTALDRHVEEVMVALTVAVEEAVPTTIPSSRSKSGWNEECAKVLAQSKRLRRQHSLYHTEETWEAYRTARNHKGRTIKKALRQNHRERIEEASQSPTNLWRVAKWARNRHNQSPNVTPALIDPATKQQANTPNEKAELLRKTFFPVPPETNLEDIENANYPAPITMPPITTREIEEAIEESSPFKAPGPDGIANKALHIASPWIKHHLTKIFNQSLALGYYPEHFRQSTTVVLRKPGKDNYTVPKAYRPIALLNTTGKIMEAVIAKRLSYIAETHGLLPDTHMGGRKLRSTEHALHLIIDKIYDAWNTGQGKVASLLLLDVSGAFDNISHARLLHNLRKRRIDERTVKWIGSFLRPRLTKLSIDGFTSEPYRLETGEPQGSNLSPILYLFYNADLIEKCGELEDTMTTGFIDDVAILTWADSTKETCKKLQEALHVAEKWAATHASIFAPDKFQLTHFTRTRTRIDVEEPLQTRWGMIEPKKTCKYLGLIMDSTLTWKQHIDEVQRKVTKTVNALGSLGGSTWGVTMREMRKIYKGVAVPQM
ncbi:hypothetical protein FOXB_16658, partial [Fusarium oxysporum f. sp. conglutinans Fo5176]